ncbi:MAG: histone deacetylase, partial [Anaerolineae bacterium]|nr:histone deacetylase [Anaerolineae bacterium]
PDGHEAHYERGHPERPGRVEAIKAAMEEAGLWDAYPHLKPIDVPQEVLHSIHNPDYLANLQDAAESGRRLDMDTYITPHSWQLALNAIGGACAVAAAVRKREAKRGFSLSRPPGHHATADRAMGFCLLNNVAVAAEYLIQIEGADRLAVIDIDLHHGNGTQDIFYPRGDVLFVSTHQSPLYPGTGHLNEVGMGDGEGATLNLPFPPYSGDLAFEAAVQKIILPLLDRYQPEMILISAGFDAHWRDPLGHLLVSTSGYANTISALVQWADENCSGRILLNLEGGYDLEASADSALASTQVLLELPWEDPLGPSPTQESTAWESVIDLSLSVHALA